MTPVDWVIVAILALSIVSAFIHGFFVEVFSLAGLIAGVLIAGFYYPEVAAFLGRFISSSTIAGFAAFVLVAVAVMVAASLIGRMLRSLFRRVGLGWMDRLAGGAFGAVKGYLLVMLAVTAMLAFFPRQPWLERSQLAPYFVSGVSTSFLPSDLGERVRRGFRIFRSTQPGSPESL